jgi:hypothetical protein
MGLCSTLVDRDCQPAIEKCSPCDGYSVSPSGRASLSATALNMASTS